MMNKNFKVGDKVYVVRSGFKPPENYKLISGEIVFLKDEERIKIRHKNIEGETVATYYLRSDTFYNPEDAVNYAIGLEQDKILKHKNNIEQIRKLLHDEGE